MRGPARRISENPRQKQQTPTRSGGQVPGESSIQWQVQDSNLRRHTPTDLQSAPIGRSGNLPGAAPPAFGRSAARRNNSAGTTPARKRHRRRQPARQEETSWPTRSSTSSARSTARRSTTRSGQTAREIATRFDFKGTGASIEWQGEHGDRDLRVRRRPGHRRPRRVQGQADQARPEPEDPRRLRAAPVRPAVSKISIALKEGITSEDAKKISKLIRDEGPKGVKAQIQGDELRVSSKKRDDLQAVQALVKAQDYDFAVQFTNYR